MTRNRKWPKEVLNLLTTWPGSILALITGVVLGMWVSSWTACADKGCEVNAGLIEAGGTWVGGVGTIIAVYWAAATYRREQQAHDQRIADAQLTKQELSDRRRALADQITLDCAVIGYHEDNVTELQFQVVNNTSHTSIFKLNGEAGGWLTFKEKHELRAGEPHAWTINMQKSAHKDLLPRRVPAADRPQWCADNLAQFTVTFEMDERIWRRTGSGPVEDVTPD